MSSPSQIQVANLDHLGLVAGMIDAIGIVEKINHLVGTQPGEKVSPGQAVKAMILNGLGLVSAPLYLFSKFFEGKATEHLIGEGIQPEHLNDDRLGRVLDKLYLSHRIEPDFCDDCYRGSSAVQGLPRNGSLRCHFLPRSWRI